tara:strand:+ start:1068 stop:1892 length:825 start_codon:yes stop_codon:yes gene_type:complete
MTKKKLSVYELKILKGKRQISEVFVNNEEEAVAAEEAGIDIITAAYGMPQFGFNATLDDMVRIRKSCPNTHLMSAPPIFSYASSYEVIKSSYSLLSIGIDSVYTANSCKWIREMTDEKIPVISHVGLIPSQVTWVGGFRAVGKTAYEAKEVYYQTLSLQDAGVFAVEMEVVPKKIASFITKNVDILTISLGSGSGCDGQYLFSQDILGTYHGKYPRHAKIYRKLRKDFERIQNERISAYKEFIKDVKLKKFNDPSITVEIEKKEYDLFLKSLSE